MITKDFFKNKRITVFGLGLNGGGVSTVKFLAKNGAKEIIVTDIKKKSELEKSIADLKGIKNITYVLGQHRPEDFTHVDMVISNPGIPWTNEYIQLARKRNIPVEMDASIFFQLCPCPIIGITGTKGKTTTSTLISEILRVAGHHVVPVGIGQVPVLNILESLKPKHVVVFELSSWRLSSLASIKKSPHIAIVTNIFPDHLNYYKTMEAYIRDKKYIFEYQKAKDFVVLNGDDNDVLQMSLGAKSQKLLFSKSGANKNASVILNENKEIILVEDESEKKILNLSEVRMRGEHNIGNILAAIVGALAYGVDIKTIHKAIIGFHGVEHRLEFVREKDGVRYYNDTAATVPEAAISALRSFDDPIILIAGGNNKGLSFTDFSREIFDRAKAVVFFKGAATDMIISEMKKYAKDGEKSVEVVDSMETAVRVASQKAIVGDIVLLSPGATSFGLFQNEFDRGEQFRKNVKNL